MTFFVALHLFTALAALVVGLAVLARKKGTPSHRWLGRTWVALMAVTATGSFWVREIRDDGGMSPIHLLSAWTLVSLVIALWAIYRGNVRQHRNFMLGTFAGLVGAGVFTLLPGRFLHTFVFG